MTEPSELDWLQVYDYTLTKNCFKDWSQSNQTGEDIAARAGATVNQANYNQMNWFTPPYYGFGGYFPVI